ncbi:hypothetical protein NP945_29210 [Mesorhizobium sp. LMG17149]|uniref:hypothetical protein n=1 Tax=Mesorhizobium sp. LMG17149 TaxID=2968497 RepID=UPI00211971F5|nr:hypothetical protein [Mesorhizobium sp. LMG17149]MCQ8875923.1 hypothetical protein [Mesorhizobium sp. LMG17149]
MRPLPPPAMVCGAPTFPEITLDDFNSLIHTVYEAGINPHKWSAFVGDLSGHLDDTLICLHAHDTVARASLGLLASGAAPEFIDSYVRDYATINVWANGMAIAPIGKLVQSEEIYDPDKLLKTEFYNDCLRSQSLVSASAVALHRSSDRMLFLSGNIRLRNHDLVRARVNRTFDLLGPHITRSFELMRHIPHQVEGEDYRATLETSTTLCCSSTEPGVSPTATVPERRCARTRLCSPSTATGTCTSRIRGPIRPCGLPWPR